MKDFVTKGDILALKQSHPDMDIKMPSVRQQRMLMLYLRGSPRSTIKAAVGDEAGSATSTFLNSDTFKLLVDLFRTREIDDIRTSRNYLTDLLFQSYHKAGSTMEEVAAIREIGKLNGLYKSDDQKANITVNQTGNIQNVKQLERLSESELLKIVEGLGDVIDPERRVVAAQPKLPASTEVLPEEVPDG